MKNFIFIALSLITVANLHAQEDQTFKVLERRVRTNQTVYHQVAMEDLDSADSFDGKYFKIVNAKSNEAIRFDEADQNLLVKAATTYHHLTLARKFWMEKAGENTQKLKKIIVRLELKNLYDEQGQFANDNRSPQFNNALSIPQGETPEWVPAEKHKKWDNEIWFRPMKKIETKDLPGIGPNPLTVSLQALEQPFINYTQNQFNQSMIEHIFYPSYAANPLWVDIIRFAGTIALTKVIIEGSKYADRLFVEKYYYLDTAMVPEVIYHEYAHIVLSDHLEMSHSTPVIEGMADYFAAALSNKKKVYAKVKGHSNAGSKDTRNNKKYSHWYESNRAATADFVLSVLWDVRETLGEEVADAIVYEARTLLDTRTATINHHLIQAVLDACTKKCEKPRSDKLKLYEAFAMKGF